jgi:hypothetical protein
VEPVHVNKLPVNANFLKLGGNLYQIIPESTTTNRYYNNLHLAGINSTATNRNASFHDFFHPNQLYVNSGFYNGNSFGGSPVYLEVNNQSNYINYNNGEFNGIDFSVPNGDINSGFHPFPNNNNYNVQDLSTTEDYEDFDNIDSNLYILE